MGHRYIESMKIIPVLPRYWTCLPEKVNAHVVMRQVPILPQASQLIGYECIGTCLPNGTAAPAISRCIIGTDNILFNIKGSETGRQNESI